MNRLTVLTVGGKLDGWARDAENRYCRLLRNWKPQVISIRAGYGPKSLEDEGRRLLERIPPNSTPIVCMTGDSPQSEELAKKFPGWLGDGGVTFIIGNYHGLHQLVLEKVPERLPLSNLTFSKEVARVVLLEQCYRCSCILSGHPYHVGPDE